MNRVVQSAWGALTECDILAAVTSQQTVAPLRELLLTILRDVTSPGGCGTTAHSCSGRLTHNINEADDATTTSRPRPLRNHPESVEAPS